MLRKICFTLAGAALLAASLLTGGPAKASPDMQTITLNTGYNHPVQHKYAVAPNVGPLGPGVGPLDSFWTVVKEPSKASQVPRPANTINKHPAWAAAAGESQWISFSPNGSGPNMKGTYVYQKCFCLTKALWDNPEAIRRSSLDLTVRADDEFYVGLNKTPDPNDPASYLIKTGTSTGGYTGPAATLSVNGEKLLSLLRPGSNCLTVRVEDMGQVITGLNIEGSLTTTGIDGIASSASPNTPSQFAACSACGRTRPDRASDVRDDIKSAVRLGTPEE